MSTQVPQHVIHLNRYYHFTELMRDPSVGAKLTRYRSEHDGSIQSLLRLSPVQTTSDKLVFFFHGMDGDCGDGIVARDLVARSSATLIAPGGRGPCWLSDSFLADAEQVIRTNSSTAQDFYLIGVSMGGAQVLSLAGLLPADMRARIAGVIALIPGSDLNAILNATSHERVRNTVHSSVSGDPSVLARRSAINLTDNYRPGLPFVIFYREQDTLLLSDALEQFIVKLRQNGHPVCTFSEEGEHNFTFKNFDYRTAFEQLGTDSSHHGAPLIVAVEQSAGQS